MRGGGAIDVRLADRSFTVRTPHPDAARALREQDEAEEVQRLTRHLSRVTAHDVAARRTLARRLTREWRWAVEPEYVEEDGDRRFNVTRELIVAFDDAASPRHVEEALTAVADGPHPRVKQTYAHLGQTYLVALPQDTELTAVEVAERLADRAAVRYAEPALVNRFEPQRSAAGAIDPVDDQFPHEWHLYSEEMIAPDVVQDADARVRAAWSTTKGSRDVVIAILDDGFDLTHPDLRGMGKVVEPVDFTEGDRQPLPVGTDYHGTCCAGVALAEENGYGCVGVAPHCAFLPVRFPFSIPDPWLIEIFRYVSRRAHIASCSWGARPGYRPLHAAVHETLTEVATHGGRDGRGLVVCVAAGNFAAPIDGEPDEPVRWLEPGEPARERTASGPMLNGLAAHPDVITVGACTSLGHRATYTNFGPELAVAAPSGDYDPRTLDRGHGRGITTSDNEPSGAGLTAGKRFTHGFTGTSAAAALVAGICGLVKTAAPALRASEVKELLRRSTEAIDDGDEARPFPGKVNARRAVAAARRAPADSLQPPDGDGAGHGGGAAPAGWVPGGFGPAGWVPGGFGPAGWVPGGFGPAGWVPGGFGPAGWVPGGFGPAGWVPGGNAPAGWVPGGYGPAGWVPGGEAPAGWVPGSPEPDTDGGGGDEGE
jgi:hypothetical protein